MNHKEFREAALDHLLKEYNPEDKQNRLPIGGKYKDSPLDHILLDRKDNIINQGFREPLIKMLEPCQNCQYKSKCKNKRKNKWHAYSSHLNSSQALAVNLLGPLCIKNQLATILGNGTKFGQVTVYEFEYRDSNSPDDDGTEFDFFFSDGINKAYFEVKYTERTLHTRTKAKDKKNLWEIHHPALKEILDGKPSDEIFFSQYQLWRNIRKVANDNSYVYFIIPEKREDLRGEIEGAKKKLKAIYRDKVKIINIEDICKEIDYHDGVMKRHYEEFKNKYIF